MCIKHKHLLNTHEPELSSLQFRLVNLIKSDFWGWGLSVWPLGGAAVVCRVHASVLSALKHQLGLLPKATHVKVQGTMDYGLGHSNTAGQESRPL